MVDKKRDVVNKLRDYGNLHKDIDNLEFKINVLNEKIIKIRTSKFEKSSTAKNYILEKLIDDKLQLEVILHMKKIQKESIDEALNILDKDEYDLITDIYCNRYTIDKICVKNRYSRSQIYKRKNKTIEKLIGLLI